MAGGLTDIVAVNCNGKVQFFSILFCLRYTIKLLINKQTFTSNLVLCTTLVLLEVGSVLPWLGRRHWMLVDKVFRGVRSSSGV